MKIIASLLTALVILCYANKATGGCHTYTVAVIDTGFGYHHKGDEAKLCRYGHKNFSKDLEMVASDNTSYKTVDPFPKDNHGHGTNVVGIIESYAKKSKVNYCIVVIKYYSNKQTPHENIEAGIKAIRYAGDINADFINYSGGGPVQDERERLATKAFLDGGGRFIAAAGNDRSDLDLPENAYYPAMGDRRVVVVGSVDLFGNKSKFSNYGKKVKRWEMGENVSAYGVTMSGTSQATAIATGKILSESRNKCDIGF